MNESNLHVYQKHGVEHVLKNPYSGLLLDMGLGKTVICLTALTHLLDSCEAGKILIIAPKRVASATWTDEIGKWEHLGGLRTSRVLGTEKQRKEALKAKADIYLINRENVVWLVTHLGGAWPFDTVIIDELSSFKSPQAARFKALKRVRPFMQRVIGLTGTPAPNGMIDLWSQLYLLDQGERLGKTITAYREAYFQQPYRHNGIPVESYKLAGANPEDLDNNVNAKAISAKIGDICVSMTAKDWLSLPPRIDTVTEITVPDVVLSGYRAFEREQVLELIGGEEVTAVNAAALSGKLRQYANGAIYVNDKKDFIEVHNEKIEALGERIEAANGNPVLVFYHFKSDVIRIQKHLKGLKPYKMETDADIADWNKGKIPFALAHPASFGHGLNMQAGGHLIEWFYRQWGSELYLQALARLDRQGQVKSVISNSLAVKGTVDFDAMSSSDAKVAGNAAMMASVKAIVKRVLGK